MKTKNSRVEVLEREVRPGDKPEVLIFWKDGVYTRGAEVITEQEYQALCQTCDVFTVEVMQRYDQADDDQTNEQAI